MTDIILLIRTRVGKRTLFSELAPSMRQTVSGRWVHSTTPGFYPRGHSPITTSPYNLDWLWGETDVTTLGTQTVSGFPDYPKRSSHSRNVLTRAPSFPIGVRLIHSMK
ncbi:hypothetical protein ACFLV9_00980 [Chloroflexota bacterium]